jgi:hypothetical protein
MFVFIDKIQIRVILLRDQAAIAITLEALRQNLYCALT